jgi:ribosomal protein S27AE
MASRKKIEKMSIKGMRCPRCGSSMVFEKFYDINNTFFGWHCLICGEILDAVILLHRLSKDAGLQIPEEENEIMHLLKKFLPDKTKGLKGKNRGGNWALALNTRQHSAKNELE